MDQGRDREVEGEVAVEVGSIRGGAAVVPLERRGTLRVTGTDRTRFLNGMLTQDVTKLAAGDGLMALKVNHRGRIEGLLRVRARDDAFELDLASSARSRVREALEALIVMDDVLVTDDSETREVLALLGPSASEVLARAALPCPSEPLSFVDAGEVTVIRDDGLGVLGYELHVPRGAQASWCRSLESAGASPVSLEARDVVRVEAGVPDQDRELDEDTIPLEARLEHAISMTKGCYVGQEVIARATNLGGIKHILVGLRLEPSAEVIPGAGARILVHGEGRDTGSITSTARSPLGPLALGFVRKADEASGTPVMVMDPSRGVRVPGVIVSLPFVAPSILGC